MTIAFTSAHMAFLRAYSAANYPDECCALILGKSGEGTREVQEIYPVQNAWTEESATLWQDTELHPQAQKGTPGDRYAIKPAEMLNAQKYAREQGWGIIGIFHSHPNSSPKPSQLDSAIAWSEYVYVILSVMQGRAGSLAAWQLDKETQFQAVEILTIVD
ncbi:MAG: M67 family metallopeptidase [Cyanobacteria bacterium P01_H01_bin.15]